MKNERVDDFSWIVLGVLLQKRKAFSMFSDLATAWRKLPVKHWII